MKPRAFFLFAASTAAAVTGLAALTGCNRTYAETRAAARTDRGQYLVERVGLCIDCHSPRHPDGSFDRARWLTGAPIAFAPTMPMPTWAPVAPPLAGVIAGYTDEQAVRLLVTGLNRHNQPPRPPMPPYAFSRSDAEAVVAYLRSLGEENRN